MTKNIFSSNAYNIAYEQEYLNATILHYPPLWVTLGIISACTYSCAFCAYHSKDAKESSKIYNVPYIMPLEMAKKCIDFLHSGGVPKVHVCATGEPLLHRDFFSIIDYVIEKYGFVTFQSNLDRKLIEKRNALLKIKERENNIKSITIDLMGNDAIKYGGNNEELYATLKELSATSIPLIYGNYLLVRSGCDDLENVVKDLARHKLRVTLSVNPVFPYGFNDFTAPENMWLPNDMEMNARLNEIRALAHSLGVKLAINFPPRKTSLNCAVFWKKFQIWPTKGSDAGRLDNVIPHGCSAVTLGDMASFGNLLDYKNVMELWNNNKFIAVRQKLLEGKFPDKECGKCHYSVGLVDN